MNKSWKWIKRVLWFFLGLFVLLFLAVSVIVYLVNSESYLEDYLTENLGVEASIGELDVSLLSGTVNISSSVIGPKDAPYIEFENLQGELNYSHLWSSQLTIDLLQLTNAKIRYPFEFKLKSSDQEAGDSNLPFDFIDVAAIDIDNLDFEYQEIGLLAEGAEIKVRNLPVAESGFLLFDDLERLVKASQTTVEASLNKLQSNKTQLNDLKLSAHIEQQKLIIEEATSGQSFINIDLLDHSPATAKADNASTQDSSLEIPFTDVVVKTIDLGKTDLLIQDKEELSIKAIQAEFSGLLLVQNKKALWLDWENFYQVQDSHFKLSSEAMKSETLDYAELKLTGELKQGQFTIPTLVVQKPTLKIAANGSRSGSQKNESASEEKTNWYLPFPSARLVSAEIEQGSFDFSQGEQQHQINDINLELADIPLVVNHQPVFAIETLSFEQPATVSLQSAAYSGSLGSVEKVSSQLVLQGSSVTIQRLNVQRPQIDYQVTAQTNSGTETNATKLPLDTIMLEQLTVNNADFAVSHEQQSYSGQEVNVELKTVPIYGQQQWLVAQPKLWQELANLKLDAESLVLPQGSLTGLMMNSSLQDNQVTVSQLQLAGADLAINTEDTGEQVSGEETVLPVESLELENIDLRQLNLNYQNQDVGYQVSGAALTLDYFPLIRQGQLVTDPIPLMQGKTNRLNLSFAQLQTPQGTVRGLTTRGRLNNKDLVLDYLRTDSADLKVSSREATDEQDTETEAAEPFILRTVKVGDLKLQNVSAEIEQADAERISVEGLYLGATELMLAKNHQLINEWYDTQLENAFVLVALSVEHIQQQQNDIRHLTVTAVQNERQIKVQPLRLIYNEAPLSADWTIDLTQQPYRSTYQSEINNLLLEKLIEPADEQSVAMQGTLKVDIDIHFDGLDAETLFSSLDGNLLVTNQTPVTLKRLNVNKVLRSFLDSQSFGLLDVGGFLLAGPFGLLASQGVSLQDTMSQLGADKGDTIFPNLHMDMTIKDGMITTKDVAAATQKYRFAFNGQVDLGKQEFKKLKFDVINKKGCSEYGQTLNGSLTSPEIETFTAAFDAVTGSIVGLFKQGVGLITGGACFTVYEGVVPHPEDGVEIIPKERQRTIDPNAPEEEPTEGDN